MLDFNHRPKFHEQVGALIVGFRVSGGGGRATVVRRLGVGCPGLDQFAHAHPQQAQAPAQVHPLQAQAGGQANFAGGLIETVWVVGLKAATTPLGWAVTIGAIAVNFALLMRAIRFLPVGSVYAVFCGLGAAASVVAVTVRPAPRNMPYRLTAAAARSKRSRPP